MGTNVRPNIVTNGLVLALDAANIKSYPRTGTTWTDLSGNNNSGSLVNSPTFNNLNGGSIVFNGTNQNIDCGNTSLGIAAGATQITLESWVYPTSFTSYRGIISRIGASSPFGGWMLNVNSDSGNKFDFAVNISGTWRTWVTSGGTFSTPLTTNTWYHLVGTYNGSVIALYLDGVLINQFSAVGTIQYVGSLSNLLVGQNGGGASYFPGRIAVARVYNRALTASEIQQNYNALKSRFAPIITQQTASSPSSYESLTYLATGTITLTNNGTDNVSMFKTSGTSAWDSHFYSTTPFTAPCTIEFNKQAGATDNGVSYAMISWNADPTLNASYTSLDYASYPYATNNYIVYNNGSVVQNGGSWSTANKFYIVYDTDGFIRHYNGSSLLYSVNSGAGRTVYVDSSLYSVNATFGGFSNVRVRRNSWNGTSYV
jgi:hypothetical protein